MLFRNRQEAGRILAGRLATYAKRLDVIVLGLPRGGVPVAFEVASELCVPLDVFLIRKLGVPGHEELAFGAVASGGVRVLDQEIVEALAISDFAIKAVTAKETAELKRRERAFRGDRPAPDVEGQTVIMIDDGIATGSSMLAGIKALRELRPARIVIGTPVAPFSTCKRLISEVDELVCIDMPETFYAIGQFYEDFSQVSDEEVVELLSRARTMAVGRAV